jgi:hypothetical protein
MIKSAQTNLSAAVTADTDESYRRQRERGGGTIVETVWMASTRTDGAPSLKSEILSPLAFPKIAPRRDREDDVDFRRVVHPRGHPRDDFERG